MLKKYTLKKNILLASNFIFRICTNFYNTAGTTRAGSLAFTLLLSFIPFTIFMAGLVGLLPFSNMYVSKVEQYFFTNSIPHGGIQIYNQVKIFLLHSHNLSWVGFTSFMITTYLMLFAVENQLNGLWSTNRKYSIRKSLVFHTIFLASSLVTLITLSILSIYSHVFLQSNLISFLIDKSLTKLLPVALFTICYLTFPNYKIKFLHAVLAGITATILFILSKRIFVLYAKYIFINYHVIYGSLALFPILMIWVYTSCLNLLFSAEIIYGFQTQYNSKLQRNFYRLFKKKSVK